MKKLISYIKLSIYINLYQFISILHLTFITFWVVDLNAQSIYWAPYNEVFLLQDTFYTGDTTEAIGIGTYPDPQLHIFLKKYIIPEECDTRPYINVFSDDFPGTILDTTRWLTEYPYPEPFNIIHNPTSNSVNFRENVEVDNGWLRLKLKKLETPMSFEWEDDEGNHHTKTLHWSSGVIHTNNQLPSSSNPSGCFRFGKFCSKIQIPAPLGHWGAYWLYGWPGEIDIFEFCLPECNELQTTLHQWNLPNGVLSLGHPAYPADHIFSGLSSSFHEYCLEWTPYKVEWSIDGQPFRTFYRYYRKEDDGHGIAFWALDCDDILSYAEGDTSIMLYEHIAWNRFDIFFLEVILNTAITLDVNPPNVQSEMIVDWVKVDQKKDYELEGETYLCDRSQTYTFDLNGSNIPSLVNWSVTQGVNIISQNDTSITLQPGTRFSGEVWIRATIPNHESCYDLVMEKLIYVGSPGIVSVDIVSEPCEGWVSLFVSPASTFNSYNWNVVSGANLLAASLNAAQFEYPIGTNTIEYEVTISNECGDDTHSETIQLEDCEGDQKNIVVFPNPANDQITVEFENFTSQEMENAMLHVVDPLLNTVKTQNIDQLEVQVSVVGIQPGYYYICVPIPGDIIYSAKFLIQN
ncbi:MAG: family 16 glycosylhydrolase [Saprospiraceae bacterium]|nr:family 16 glycosylhydrolase [Saprospiraceae bacterium]